MAPVMTLAVTRALTAIRSASLWVLLAMTLLCLPAANAQDTQYISDMVLVPVRSGAGYGLN